MNQQEWQQVDFPAHLYFDLDLGEEAAVDSVPKHDQAIGYLKVDPGVVQHTVLTIKNDSTGASRVISETFWNEGKNSVVEINEVGKEGSHSELIVETKVNQQPPVTEIVRAWKKQGPWTLAYHVFILTNPDGSETEKKVFPPEPQ